VNQEKKADFGVDKMKEDAKTSEVSLVRDGREGKATRAQVLVVRKVD
jgi:hypothetical protein